MVKFWHLKYWPITWEWCVWDQVFRWPKCLQWPPTTFSYRHLHNSKIVAPQLFNVGRHSPTNPQPPQSQDIWSEKHENVRWVFHADGMPDSVGWPRPTSFYSLSDPPTPRFVLFGWGGATALDHSCCDGTPFPLKNVHTKTPTAWGEKTHNAAAQFARAHHFWLKIKPGVSRHTALRRMVASTSALLSATRNKRPKITEPAAHSPYCSSEQAVRACQEPNRWFSFLPGTLLFSSLPVL